MKPRARPGRAPRRRARWTTFLAGRGSGTWLRKPLRGGGGRGVRGWIGGRLGPTEIVQRRVHGLSCSAVAIGDGRRATVLGITEQLHRPSSFQWTGNVTPPRLPERRAGRAGRPAARGLRRGGGAVRRAWGLRGGCDLGRAPRVGARGEPTTARRARAVRTGQLRGPRPRGTRPRRPRRRPAACGEMCNREARAVRRPRRPRAGSRVVADGAGARHPPRREPIKRGAPVCTLISAARRGAGDRGARRTATGCAPRSGAGRCLSSAHPPRSPARAADCLCDDVTVDRGGDAVRLQPDCEPGRRVVLGVRRGGWARRRRRSAVSLPTSRRRSAAPPSCCARRGVRSCTASTGPPWRTRGPRSRWPTRSGRWSRPTRVGGDVAGCPGDAAARRVHRHAGRDPRSLAARRDLARGSRDHPPAAARAPRLRRRGPPRRRRANARRRR